MKQKKVPQRMCVVCRQMFDKKELIRIVRNADGVVMVDKTGKMSGRGAYICKNPDCAAKCIKTKAFNRVFKCDVSMEQYNSVLEELKLVRE